MLQYQTIKPGDIIVSSPYIGKGVIFNKSVILIMSCDKDGASGIIINKLLNKLNGDEILNSLEVSRSNNKINKTSVASKSANLPVYFGGPVEQEKGIIIHSNDYSNHLAMRITTEISVSTNSQIVSDIVSGKGPAHKMLILGYASWTAAQLVAEIKRNDWLLLLDSNNNQSHGAVFELLFIEDYLYKWERALKLAGVNCSNYTNIVGNA